MLVRSGDLGAAEGAPSTCAVSFIKFLFMCCFGLFPPTTM